MLETDLQETQIHENKQMPLAWTTGGPLDHNSPQKSAINSPSKATVNLFNNSEERVKTVKGIDKRISKDGTVSYRARVRIKGHPILSKTFSSMTLAKQWKKETEVEIEKGRYFDRIEAQKHTLGESIDRYIKHILPSKPKNAKEENDGYYFELVFLNLILFSNVFFSKTPLTFLNCLLKYF